MVNFAEPDIAEVRGIGFHAVGWIGEGTRLARRVQAGCTFPPMARRRPRANIGGDRNGPFGRRGLLKEEARVRYFDEPTRLEVDTNVRPALLHLMGNHRPGSGDDPAGLLEVADAYLRLNPQDAEVLKARERLVGEGRPVCA